MRAELPPAGETARAAAEELSQPKYRPVEPWWTQVVEWLERMWIRFVEWLVTASDAVGGPLVMGLIVGLVVIALAVVVTANLGRRRARNVEARLRREYEISLGLDPAELEERAASAERSGDLETAFRLLFRAALVRFDRAGLIDLKPGTTSGTISESLDSERFDQVARRFDLVVYGDQPAAPTDPSSVRELLSHLLGVKR